MPLASDSAQFRALDLSLGDWTWLYELAFWLSPDSSVADLPALVPNAQAALTELLDSGFAEVATLDREAGVYTALDPDAARRVVMDPNSWRTAEDLVKHGSAVLFAYGMTETGREALFGAS